MRIKGKSLTTKTAKELGLSEELVNDVVNFYYENLRSKMENLEEARIRVRGLGVFYASEKKLKLSIKKLQYIVDNKEIKSFTDVKIIEKNKALIEMQKKILVKVVKEREEYESNKNLQK